MVNRIRTVLGRGRGRLPAGALRPSPHVSTARSEGRTLLLDTRSARFWGLDEVGGAIWTCVEEQCDVATAVARVQQRFDAPAATVEADVRAFVARLLRARLVEAA